ncbi:hypothetical protein GCM10020000_23780 [Streptomyces olivoverticillatus]
MLPQKFSAATTRIVLPEAPSGVLPPVFDEEEAGLEVEQAAADTAVSTAMAAADEMRTAGRARRGVGGRRRGCSWGGSFGGQAHPEGR